MRSGALPMPFAAALVLGTALSVQAATPAELLRCEKAIHGRATTFVKLVQTALTNCTYKVESCELAHEIDGDDPTQCLASASASCGGYSGKVPSYKAASSNKALLSCATISLADLQPWVAGLGFVAADPSCTIGSVSDLLDCLFDGAQCTAERTVFALDPRAAAALATAGIGAAHPCVAP